MLYYEKSIDLDGIYFPCRTASIGLGFMGFCF